MRRKFILSLLLSFCLLINLSSGAQPDDGVPSSVENIFTTPNITVLESEPASTAAQGLTSDAWQNAWPGQVGMSLGFQFLQETEDNIGYYVYDGDELHAQVYLNTYGMTQIGAGIFVFLDGQIQPYRLSNEDTYSYMHTFYQEDDVAYVYDIYLTPVTGEAGEQLEMQIMGITWPDYFLDKSISVGTHTKGTTGSCGLLIYEATPDAVEMPAVTERMVSYCVDYQDLSSSEITGWDAEKMRNEYEYHTSIAGCVDGGSVYSFCAGDNIEFHYEIWGNTQGSFGLVLFVDNEPISVKPENAIYFSNQNGKKTIVTVQLDLSDFDGSSVIYGVLLSRNYLCDGIGNGAFEGFREFDPYYLCDAQDIFDLMGWERPEGY